MIVAVASGKGGAIKKADLNPRRAGEIVAFCTARGGEAAGRISHDTVVTEAMVYGMPVTAYTDGAVGWALKGVWAHLEIVSGSAACRSPSMIAARSASGRDQEPFCD